MVSPAANPRGAVTQRVKPTSWFGPARLCTVLCDLALQQKRAQQACPLSCERPSSKVNPQLASGNLIWGRLPSLTDKTDPLCLNFLYKQYGSR